MVQRIKELMYDQEHIRNMGIAAHIDHGKTTLSDNLLSGAGMISEELAGKQLFLDFDEQEKARGITINAANVSMVHKNDGQDYLINLIDTPGHVDFGGDVTRAMRAVDGAVVVVCAVEGVMPQTKTVINQALKERVKPVLFINKVDRLINELKLSSDELQQRFVKIISDVNKLIKLMGPEEVDWTVRVQDGSVAFGSAYNNWATSVSYMQKSKIGFGDIVNYCNEDNQEELAKRSPLHEIILDMVIKHLPNPLQAQKIRIPQIWKGDPDSEVYTAMLNCDPDKKLSMMITKITLDKHAGEVATGRIFSGTVKSGDEVYLIGAKSKERTQQVGVYMGPARQNIEKIPAGNIVAITGLKKASAGETVSTEDIEPFEGLQYYSEPVVTEAVEAKSMKDLPKVIEVLRQIAKEDPTLQVKIDEETGEHLLSGMGELHLEVIERRIKERGVEVETSEPIVVYRETIEGESKTVEGKSPNKHNKFYICVEPLEKNVYDAITGGDIKEGRRKDKSKDIRAQLVDLGMDREEARRIIDIYHGNVMIDLTRGVQHLDEVMELMLDAFEQTMDSGPLAKEPMNRVKVKLMDSKLHEDAIHRGPAQVYPAVRRPIYATILLSKPLLLEPVQRIWIDVPQSYMGTITRELQRRRGQILSMNQKEELISVEGKMPIAESFGLAGDIRGASEGHALWSTENSGFEKLPYELQSKIIIQIRDRKGLKRDLPIPQDFME